MGGICAVVRFDGEAVGEADLRRMLDENAFRGPDGSGTWIDESAGLGQHAFWVRAVDRGVVKPLVAHDIVVSADCRLDNRAELIARLRLDDDQPDVVLVAAAYRRWGEHFATELLGDFALIVWDRTRHKLVLARDAMGMRTLYFRFEPARRVLAATEAGQIICDPDVPAVPDRDMMVAHLGERELTLEESFLQGISQVAPGEVVVVDRGGVRRSRFWQPDFEHRIRLADEGEYAEALRELLVESVRARCSGVLPTGLMLSGGVDSGAIAATAGWLAQEGDIAPIHTYSWASARFPEADERAISGRLVRRWGLPAMAVPVDDALPLSGWPRVGPHLDDAHHGVFTEGLLALLGAARSEGMGVVMSGDRGDLMTAGWVLRYPSLLRRGRLGWLAAEIREQHRERGVGLHRIIARDVLAASWRTVVRRMRARRSVPTETMPWITARSNLGRSRASGDAATVNRWGYSRSHRLELVQATSVTRNIAWTDRLHARAGVGFADPWSDRRIAEFVLAIPQHQLMGPGEIDEKRLARNAIAPFVAGIDGPDMAKVAPGVMFAAGLEAARSELADELFSGSRTGGLGLIDEARFRHALHEFERTGVIPRGLWPTISLELWLRAHWD